MTHKQRYAALLLTALMVLLLVLNWGQPVPPYSPVF